jgi:chromosome segregation protein
VAAALGPLGDALVVASRTTAREAVGFVRSRRSGRVLLLAADDASVEVPTEGERSRDRELADLGARPLVEALRAPDGIMRALERALRGVYAVTDFEVACRLAPRHPDLAFVTVDGEVAGPHGYAGGSAVTSSAVLSRAAAEQAEAQLAVVERDLLVAHRRLGDADRELQAARRELEAASAAMQESDGQITAAAERQNRLHKERETCLRELAALEAQEADLAREIAGQRERLAGLEARGPDHAAAVLDDQPEGPDLEAERLDDLLSEAREREVEARLAASAVEQRGQELARRIEALEAEAADVERQLAERERRRIERLTAIERCGELAVVASAALVRTEDSLRVAVAERDRVEEERAERQRHLGVARARLRELEEALAALRDERHAEDLRRAELRHELDAVRAHLADELGVDPDEALAAARVAAADPAAALAALEPAARKLRGLDDAGLVEAEERLVRKVGLLGSVNPLALQEFQQMEERHRFLTEQIDDLRRSRRDLMEVVEKVDERIREIFAAAFVDVAAQFERIFPTLFPGGEGKLVLTDPQDLLETGVEVEARPPGKRVKRLSLLSGGERSLTALAVLFAIFAARPSPFYVLDEVEAALDDVNLQRFLDVIREFRSSSQLIIVTHQKRTMEVADLLYGVSMQGDGVSKVISQRMSEVAGARV